MRLAAHQPRNSARAVAAHDDVVVQQSDPSQWRVVHWHLSCPASKHHSYIRIIGTQTGNAIYNTIFLKTKVRVR